MILDSKVTSGFAPGQQHNTISLGRPWRPYARVVYILTKLPANVIPQGWSAWGHKDKVSLAYFAEYKDYGPGANPAARAVVASTHRAAGSTIYAACVSGW